MIDPRTAPIFSLDLAAVVRAGDRAGSYLDTLGKTDLAQLSPSEWERFCAILISAAFDAALDQTIRRYEQPLSNEVPF